MSSMKRGFSIRIQIGMVSLILLAIFISAAIIFIPWYVISTNNISAVVTSLNEQVMNGVRSEVSGLFGNAVLTQSIIRDNFSRGIVALDEKAKLQRFYLSLLKNNPNFSWVSLGFPNGDFSGVQRVDGKTLKVVDSRWNPKKNRAVRTISFYRVLPGEVKLYSRRVLKNHPYCSLKRSWYRKAVKHSGHVWTDVYIFSTSGKPGINSAIAFEVNGKFSGVISIALELEAISSYLKQLKVGETGVAFLMDSRERLVAFPEVQEVVLRQKGNKASLAKIGSSRNRFLRVAAAAVKKSGYRIAEIKSFSMFKHKDEQSGRSYFVALSPAQHRDWVVCTVIPEDDYLGAVKESIKYLFLAIAVLIVLSAFLLTLFSRFFLVRPLQRITKQFSLIQEMRLDSTEYIPTRVKEIGMLSDGVVHMSRGLASFQKYLPTEIVREMISQGIKAELNGEERDMTIFFSDIAGFTSVFEKQGNRMVNQLGRYFGSLSAQINLFGGSIDKYIGDSIMAFWGAPRPNKEHALDGCRAALACQAALSGLRAEWEREDLPHLPTRIGLNTGRVVVGNLGSESRLNYTVIGDPVNLSSRLESLNKFYSTSILIGEETYEQARHGIVARKVDEVAVYGKSESTAVYELIALKDQVHVTDNFDWISVYERAREMYRSREWAKAAGLFEEVKKMRGGDDRPSSMFLVLCLEYLKNPPAEDWTGVTVMGKK